MALADLGVGLIVAGRDLERAGAERAFHGGICDDWNGVRRERALDKPADQFLIAFILRVHCHGDVGEDGLGARGCHDDAVAAVFRAVPNVVERAGHVLVLDFGVRERGAAARAPVHQTSAAIDQAPRDRAARRP